MRQIKYQLTYDSEISLNRSILFTLIMDLPVRVRKNLNSFETLCKIFHYFFNGSFIEIFTHIFLLRNLYV